MEDTSTALCHSKIHPSFDFFKWIDSTDLLFYFVLKSESETITLDKVKC